MTKEVLTWLEGVEGLTVSARSAARAFAVIDIETVAELVKYLIADKELKHRPKGIGEDNYKMLVAYAVKYAMNNEPVTVGLTCTNGVSITGCISKQDYGEFTTVVDAIQIWFEAHRIN